MLVSLKLSLNLIKSSRLFILQSFLPILLLLIVLYHNVSLFIFIVFPSVFTLFISIISNIIMVLLFNFVIVIVVVFFCENYL